MAPTLPAWSVTDMVMLSGPFGSEVMSTGAIVCAVDVIVPLPVIGVPLKPAFSLVIV